MLHNACVHYELTSAENEWLTLLWAAYHQTLTHWVRNLSAVPALCTSPCCVLRGGNMADRGTHCELCEEDVTWSPSHTFLSWGLSWAINMDMLSLFHTHEWLVKYSKTIMALWRRVIVFIILSEQGRDAQEKRVEECEKRSLRRVKLLVLRPQRFIDKTIRGGRLERRRRKSEGWTGIIWRIKRI